MSADGSDNVERFVSGLKVVELRDELKKRGVTSYGVKSVLAERLVEAMKAETKGEGGKVDVHLQDEENEDGERQQVEDYPQQQPENLDQEREQAEPSAHAQEDGGDEAGE